MLQKMNLEDFHFFLLFETGIGKLVTKAAIDNMWTNGHDCFPIKFNLQIQAIGQIWLPAHNLPNPSLELFRMYRNTLYKKLNRTPY